MTFDCLYEERAAIMQYQGGMTCSQAEDAAYRCCYRKMEMTKKPDGGVEFKHTLSANKPAEKQVAKPEEQQTLWSFEEFQAQARKRFGYE